MKIKVKTPDITLKLNGRALLTFEVSKSSIEELKCLKTDDLELELKEWHNKRTLDQNALLWELIGKLSQKLVRPRVDIYRQYIKDYGKVEYIPLRNDAVDYFMQVWEKNGLGSFAERFRESKMKGYIVVAVYYGSSTYNTKEMIDLITPIIADCEELGIETFNIDYFKNVKNKVDKKSN